MRMPVATVVPGLVSKSLNNDDDRKTRADRTRTHPYGSCSPAYGPSWVSCRIVELKPIYSLGLIHNLITDKTMNSYRAKPLLLVI
jgi:hypothetical protein